MTTTFTITAAPKTTNAYVKLFGTIQGTSTSIEVIAYCEELDPPYNTYTKSGSTHHVVLYGGTPDAYQTIKSWNVSVNEIHQFDCDESQPSPYPVQTYWTCAPEVINPVICFEHLPHGIAVVKWLATHLNHDAVTATTREWLTKLGEHINRELSLSRVVKEIGHVHPRKHGNGHGAHHDNPNP